LIFQNVDETPDYTDSDTNPNTTASSVVGEPVFDGRKRRSEANQLRRSIFGKKHDRLGESKVGLAFSGLGGSNALLLTLAIGR
jgi:hypothetical protein